MGACYEAGIYVYNIYYVRSNRQTFLYMVVLFASLQSVLNETLPSVGLLSLCVCGVFGFAPLCHHIKKFFNFVQ